jgi:thiopurine S-methyltransferase
MLISLHVLFYIPYVTDDDINFMEHEFWHAKWASNRIGFHLDDVNPLLLTHWHETSPNADDAVLVPLCGLFSERFYTPMVTKIDSYHSLYQFDELSIYAGDVFTVPLEPVDIIYDRAALVALREDQRAGYVSKLF